MSEQRGVVIHIAEGSYDGTIAWQRNPTANVSSHFIVAADGRVAQMVDTNDRAWTQIGGNGHWLSVENEGHTPNPLSPAQVDANAKILARWHQVYGGPLQLAASPAGKGLGHHSMGGAAWGHLDCPGPAIVAQKPAILAKAILLTTGAAAAPTLGDDMLFLGQEFGDTGHTWVGNGVTRVPVHTGDDLAHLQQHIRGGGGDPTVHVYGQPGTPLEHVGLDVIGKEPVAATITLTDDQVAKLRLTAGDVAAEFARRLSA